MSLREDMWKYEQITGESAEHVPIIKLGAFLDGYDMGIKALEIELLTDKEQRIFLKAISREREVCQRVDDEYSDDDSKVSLVKVCNSIERKVKKIWE